VSLLRRAARIQVLDRSATVVDGIRFAGWADPVSTRHGYGDVNPTAEELDALERRIRGDVAGMAHRPDVLLVHNHRVAQRLGGLAPVILYGHDHRPSVRRTPEGIFIDAGTTGGAGARYFEVDGGVPYSAVVLHFSRKHPGHLLAADLLQVRGSEGEFALQRYILNGTATATAPGVFAAEPPK